MNVGEVGPVHVCCGTYPGHRDNCTADDMTEDAGTKTFYLLACLECGDPERPLPMPFGDPAERGKWASEHTRATGHDRWRVWEETR